LIFVQVAGFWRFLRNSRNANIPDRSGQPEHLYLEGELLEILDGEEGVEEYGLEKISKIGGGINGITWYL
jgi:hypothetical protein